MNLPGFFICLALSYNFIAPLDGLTNFLSKKDKEEVNNSSNLVSSLGFYQDFVKPIETNSILSDHKLRPVYAGFNFSFRLPLSSDNFEKKEISLKSKEINLKLDQIKSLLDSSEIYLSRDLETSLIFAKEAKVVAEKSGSKQVERRILLQFGKIYLEMGFLGDAVESYLEIVVEQGNSDSKIFEYPLALLGIGEVLMLCDQPDKALPYLEEAKELIRSSEFSNSERIPELHLSFAKLYLKKKEYIKAHSQLIQGLEYLKNEKASGLKIIFINLLGEVYASMGNIPLSNTYFREAQLHAIELKDRNGLSWALIGIGTNFYEVGEMQKAITESLEAFRHADSLGNEIRIRDIAAKLSKWYGEQVEIERSAYFSLVKNIASLLTDKGEALAEIEELELKNKANIELNYLEEELFNSLKFKVALAIFLILIFIPFSFAYFKERKKQKNIMLELNQINSELKVLEKENDAIQLQLIQKEKKMVSDLISILKKENQLEEIQNRFLELKKQIKNSNQKIVSEILEDFYHLKNEGTLSKAKETLYELNKGFLSKLLQDYPNLSKNEQYLCIFFRLGFNLTEIASIQRVQIESIRVLKSRLSKKLDLSKEGISLYDFLKKYEGE